jgi:hypothetical protein
VLHKAGRLWAGCGPASRLWTYGGRGRRSGNRLLSRSVIGFPAKRLGHGISIGGEDMGQEQYRGNQPAPAGIFARALEPEPAEYPVHVGGIEIGAGVGQGGKLPGGRQCLVL